MRISSTATLLLQLLCLLQVTVHSFSYAGHSVRLPLWSFTGGSSSGSWKKLFRMPPAQRYRKMLQEQCSLLDRQLRQSQEELLVTKKRFTALQNQQLSVTARSSVERRTLEAARLKEVQTLKQQVADMQLQVTKIEAMKQEMEELLEKQEKQLLALQESLVTVGQEAMQAQERFNVELASLTQQLESKTRTQLDELQAMMERQMADALARAEKIHKQQLQEASVSAEKSEKKAVQTAEERVQRQADQTLQTERKEAAAAIEREKIKMRKLVKALAKRETKLLAASQKAKTSKTTARHVSAGADSKSVQRKAESVRGPLK